MNLRKNKSAKKQNGVLPGLIAFIIANIISINILIGYSKIYKDKQFADVITCSEALNEQVYECVMRSFARVTSISDLMASRGLSLLDDSAHLDAIISGTQISGVFFAPDFVVKGVYPEEKMSNYMNLDLTSTFPESLNKFILLTSNDPIILGPYTVPGSSEQAMAIICPYYKTSRNVREIAGRVGVIVDYPQIFKSIDFSIAKEKKVLFKIWRSSATDGKPVTILESKDALPDNFWENCTTFKKLYLTSIFNFSFIPKHTFFRSYDFLLVLIALAFFNSITSTATFIIFRGIANSRDLKMLKMQSKLVKIQEHTIFSLSNLVENRDSDTGEHVRRTSDYVYMIATEARHAGLYSDILTDEYIDMLKNAAPMHDIGKIAVPDSILKKPGKLTPEEFDQIKLHTTAGSKMIQDIIGPVQSPDFVKITKNIAQSHHEKWNGKGYPKGLKENEIPLSARIMSLADVFDALTTPRCYKEPFPFEEAIEIIKNDSGVAFDPQLTDIFLANQDKLREIMEKYRGK